MQSARNTALRAAAALTVASLVLWGCARSGSIAPSLDRAEVLLVIVEGIETEADAERAGPAIRDWLRGCSQHDQETAWLESVSGQEYVALVEPHASRSAELRRRLERQFARMSTDSYLRPFASAMQNARGLVPQPLSR